MFKITCNPLFFTNLVGFYRDVKYNAVSFFKKTLGNIDMLYVAISGSFTAHKLNSMFKSCLLTGCCLLTISAFAQPLSSADSSQKTIIQNNIAEKRTVEESQASLKIYPNPAKNKISLQVAGFTPGIAQVKITDTKGKLWRQDNRLLTNGQEEIAMFLLLAPGIYFISITKKTTVVKKKLVIL